MIFRVLSHMCTLDYMHMISYEKHKKDYLRNHASRNTEGEMLEYTEVKSLKIHDIFGCLYETTVTSSECIPITILEN